MPEGVATRIDLTLASSTSSVARWTASGDLLHVHPGVVMLPARGRGPSGSRPRGDALGEGAAEPQFRARPLGRRGADERLLHVTVPADRYPRRTSGVVVHRTTVHLPTTRIRDIPVTSLGRGLVDTWDWAHRSKGGAARRRTDGPSGGHRVCREAADRGGGLRAESRDTAGPCRQGRSDGAVDLVEKGCESELEIWGPAHVLPGPPRGRRPCSSSTAAGRRWVRLDAAYPDALVAVELDGAAFHGSREARERDLRRDRRWRPSVGVLRFSYARLMADPEGCRREIESGRAARPTAR